MVPHVLFSSTSQTWMLLLLAEKEAGGWRLLFLCPPFRCLLMSSFPMWHSTPWQQGQWYLLTCQPLIDWHSSPSSENWIYWTAETECPCQPRLKRQGVTLSSSFKDEHRKYDMKSRNRVEHVEVTPRLKAHEWAIGDNRVTVVFSDICLLRCWLQTAAKFTSFENTASILSRIKFSRLDHISPVPGPCLRARRSTWLAMFDDTYSHLAGMATHTPSWHRSAVALAVREVDGSHCYR